MHGGIVIDATANTQEQNRPETRTAALYIMHSRVLNLSEITWRCFLNSLPDRRCLLEQPELMAQLCIPPRFFERIH